MSIEKIITMVFSAVSLVVSLYVYFQNRRKDLLPILVFSRRSATSWQIDNIGRGPALNVIVGDGTSSGNWDKVVKCYPIAADGKLVLSWLRHGAKLGVSYSDYWGNSYSTICQKDVNQIEKIRVPLFQEEDVNDREYKLKPTEATACVGAGKHGAETLDT